MQKFGNRFKKYIDVFEKITYEVYIILASDILLNFDLNLFSKLSYLQFAKYENFNNQNFTKLAKNIDLKYLSIVLENYILFISELKVGFINKNTK